jgi:hypothetical protein
MGGCSLKVHIRADKRSQPTMLSSKLPQLINQPAIFARRPPTCVVDVELRTAGLLSRLAVH